MWKLCLVFDLVVLKCVNLVFIGHFNISYLDFNLMLNFFFANPCKRKIHVKNFFFKRIFYIKSSAFPYYVKVFTGLEYSCFLLFQKYRYHVLPKSESFVPIFVIQILFNIFFLVVSIFFHKKFIKRIFQYSTKYPFLENLEVWRCSFI